jgi:hypothetical protein
MFRSIILLICVCACSDEPPPSASPAKCVPMVDLHPANAAYCAWGTSVDNSNEACGWCRLHVRSASDPVVQTHVGTAQCALVVDSYSLEDTAGGAQPWAEHLEGCAVEGDASYAIP